MNLITLFIQQHVWSHQQDYSSFDPEEYANKLKPGCQWIHGLLTFSYLNTVIATLFLTLDRNIFISRPLRYSLFVTRNKIQILILICWSLPILSGSLSFLTTNLDEVKCIVTHTSSKWPNFVTGSLIFLTIVVVYILYGKILLTYWGLKRKIS